MSTRLEDKTALVTGATRNIGRAMATAFAAEGAHLLGAARYHWWERTSRSCRSDLPGEEVPADPRESAKVLGVDAERDSRAGLRAQRLDHRLARVSENLDPRRRVERLRVRLHDSLTDHVMARDAATLPDLLDPLVEIEAALLAVRP